MKLDLAALNAGIEKREAHNEAEFQKLCEYNAICDIAAAEAEKRGYNGIAAAMFVHGFKRHSPKNVNPRKHGLESAFKEGRACAATPEMKRAIRIAAVEERKTNAEFAPGPVNVNFGASSNAE